MKIDGLAFLCCLASNLLPQSCFQDCMLCCTKTFLTTTFSTAPAVVVVRGFEWSIDTSFLIDRYEVLGVHEFDSVRKRMSVMVECPDGTIKLLVKGADTTVMEIIGGPGEISDLTKSSVKMVSLAQEKQRAEVLLRTLGHLDNYSREGLRTLVVASRELTQREVLPSHKDLNLCWTTRVTEHLVHFEHK